MMRSFVVFIALVFCVSSAVAFDLKSAKKGLDKVKELDLDGDNQINLHEFKKAGGKEKYFKKADSDKDGFISIKDAKKQLKRLY
ncbi:hypothetical protein OA92_03040 [Marinomonas sp. SBI22]|uniref:hypothetical protein n=1 Tax=unclassified Marinomonas TaxID=196814 RepID=UPI0007AF0DBB|nr:MULTISPECIES: hypothetical protein [unclassified Marinomonas]KZM38883.1 hypothetical protein OA91_23120 [Marinomonas sp. SBI8L]KZM44861.1 hypothetical protein OA92_03040 [Marinomonas sp. SBI22]